MNIVWHGNYVRYLEQARAALLGGIGFGYREMKEFGFAWPIVDLSIRYVRRCSSTRISWSARR